MSAPAKMQFCALTAGDDHASRAYRIFAHSMRLRMQAASLRLYSKALIARGKVERTRIIRKPRVG
jgi:hypothetical protein